MSHKLQINFNQDMTRKDAAKLYFEYIRHLDAADPWWADINRSIMEHWSKSGLLWIKKEAWKLYDAWKGEGTK